VREMRKVEVEECVKKLLETLLREINDMRRLIVDNEELSLA
jgi:hypothetical protein